MHFLTPYHQKKGHCGFQQYYLYKTTIRLNKFVQKTLGSMGPTALSQLRSCNNHGLHSAEYGKNCLLAVYFKKSLMCCWKNKIHVMIETLKHAFDSYPTQVSKWHYLYPDFMLRDCSDSAITRNKTTRRPQHIR